MKINIVLFWFMNDWGKYGRAYEMIATNLAKIHHVRKVICLFPPIEKEKFSFPIKLQEVNEKLFVVQRKCFVKSYGKPYRVRQWINTRTLYYLSVVFFKKLKLLEKNTILWVYPPHHDIEQLLLTVPHSFLVTQIVDNNSFRSNSSNTRKAFVKSQYERLVQKSDLVITSTKLNYDIFSKINHSCGLFENAVDCAFIREPSMLPYLKKNTRPRLGYIGWISERTDIKLMCHIAKERPNYDLIIAGPQEIALNEFGILDLPNVFYIGVIPYKEVPEFLQSIDICLIPHKDTLFSKTMSPLKLFQYLGSGRPIVSSSISGIERFKNLISVAIDYDEFIKLIDENLKTDNKMLSTKRINVAKNETWEKRVNEMSEFVIGKYAHKNKQL